MRQKKRKRIAMGAMLAFFAVSGLWYFLLHFRNGAEENGLTADKKAKTEWDKTPEAGQTAKADASEKAAGSGYVPEPEQPEQSLYVFLCGCIAKEGVYCLASGSRLYEAVELAGGLEGKPMKPITISHVFLWTVNGFIFRPKQRQASLP